MTAPHSPEFFTRNNSYTSSSATSVHDDAHPTSAADLEPKLSHALSISLTSALDNMVQVEGGGSWPPKPTYRESWPACLQIYDDVARQAPPRFVTEELRPQYNDAELRRRIDDNRAWLADSLASVDINAVMSTLPELDVRARLGFLACTAYLTHLYRWGTLPVVAMAQDEKSLTFPAPIGLPFRWLNDFYGIASSGGCLFSMTLVNVVDGDRPEMAYSNMRHMPYPAVADAERYNALVFYEMERLSLTLYRSIADAQRYVAESNDHAAAEALKSGNAALKAAFKLFFDTLKEEKIQKAVWMSHAQGFHGWGVDDFDGVSGDHSLLIRTLDAFLDIPLKTQPGCPFAKTMVEDKSSEITTPVTQANKGILARMYEWMWPSSSASASTSNPGSAPAKVASCPVSGKRMKEITFSEVPYSNHYLPTAQVHWIRSVRQAKLRHAVSPESETAKEINEMLKTFKLWRMGHTRKAVYYEDLELPERKPMTASGGVGGGVAEEQEGLAQMITKLEARLRARISATK
ncbi:hypothetical protein BCV70DRAFT_210522 [Testicularia cyperi]|uniref:Indoleamine 2,3-dioxygenase n=1 Tax=Testicularia cyperi TaxID=1882483 RepID=A0A317XVU7_9BASI|nr:hypothetical protein BCV70DRAFT_210522 [Testicularia cyperi]